MKIEATIVLLLVVPAGSLRAQVLLQQSQAPAVGSPLGQEASSPNTVVYGLRTAVSHDTNAASGSPAVPNTEYTMYPEISLFLSRPRWASAFTYMPGLSYSSANIPAYNTVSHMLSAVVDYRTSERLTLEFRNSFVSSSNPFDSLNSTTKAPQFGVLQTATALSWNYLPKTNEQAGIDAVYALNGRTSVRAGALYNYLAYSTNSSGPGQNGAFDNSNSLLYTLGVFRENTKRFSSGMQYTGQRLDAGHGLTTTTAQTVACVAQFAVAPTLQLSAIVGPQYADTKVKPGEGAVLGFNGGASWSWMGGATASWGYKGLGMSASAIRQLSSGNPYQGNVRQTSFNFQVGRDFRKRATANIFAGYSIEEPLLANYSSGASGKNNYLSTGVGITKRLNNRFAVSATYWYLSQSNSSAAKQFYSGDHNRVEFSFSYVIAKPVRR